VIKFTVMEQCTCYKLGNLKKLLSKRKPDKKLPKKYCLPRISSSILTGMILKLGLSLRMDYVQFGHLKEGVC
jgi:hypothetical protein